MCQCHDQAPPSPYPLPQNRRAFARAILIAQANMLRTLDGVMRHQTPEFKRHYEILLTSCRTAIAALDAGKDIELDSHGGILRSALRSEQ